MISILTLYRKNFSIYIVIDSGTQSSKFMAFDMHLQFTQLFMSMFTRYKSYCEIKDKDNFHYYDY